MYKENNAGPRDDPCGTPDSREIMSDKNVPNLTIAETSMQITGFFRGGGGKCVGVHQETVNRP